MKKSQIEFYEGVDGGWRWRERASNGQITATCGEGNGFKTLRNAKRNFTMHAARMKLGKWSAKVLMLLAGLAVVVAVNGCALIGKFDQNSYNAAQALKEDAVGIVLHPSPSAVDNLAVRLDAAVAYETGKGKANKISVAQWKLIANPHANLLGGWIKLYRQGATMSPTYSEEKARQIGLAFDEVLKLEGGKIR
jgi:uncharacterized protein YegP (UPF0339 family)